MLSADWSHGSGCVCPAHKHIKPQRLSKQLLGLCLPGFVCSALFCLFVFPLGKCSTGHCCVPLWTWFVTVQPTLQGTYLNWPCRNLCLGSLCWMWNSGYRLQVATLGRDQKGEVHSGSWSLASLICYLGSQTLFSPQCCSLGSSSAYRIWSLSYQLATRIVPSETKKQSLPRCGGTCYNPTTVGGRGMKIAGLSSAWTCFKKE